MDDYKLKIYRSLQHKPSPKGEPGPSFPLCSEASALVGYMCGNSPHDGCLTSDTNVRIHSCEKGNMCETAQEPSVVRIQPIVARLPDGSQLAEEGVGGGGDDLERAAEINQLTRQDLEFLLSETDATR